MNYIQGTTLLLDKSDLLLIDINCVTFCHILKLFLVI